MQYKGHPLRHELKYLINYSEYYTIRSVIRSVMTPDKHSGTGGYFIRSLYFDDIYHSSYDEKQAGVAKRRKWRLRTYNMSDRVIKFEIKDKFDSYISKMSATVTKNECLSMIEKDFDFMLTEKNKVLLTGFADARLRRLSPCVIVDYDREAFVSYEGNVRITFDKGVRAAIGSHNLFDSSLITVPAIDEGLMILEVKYDDYLPLKVRKLFAPINSRMMSLSKFTLCYNAQRTYNYMGKETIHEVL